MYDPEKRRQQHVKNKEFDNERNRRWYQANKKLHNKKTLKNYHNNRESRLRKQYQRTDTEEHKLKHNAYMRERHWRNRNSLISLLGGMCMHPDCGVSDFRVLQFDHIIGDGNYDKQRLFNHTGSTRLVDYYHKRPEEAKRDLQMLCANHNIIKCWENHERRIKIN